MSGEVSKTFQKVSEAFKSMDRVSTLRPRHTMKCPEQTQDALAMRFVGEIRCVRMAGDVEWS